MDFIGETKMIITSLFTKSIKKHFFIIAFLILLFSLYSKDAIITWDKKTINTSNMQYQDGNFIIDNDNTIDISKISYISFNTTANTTKSQTIYDISPKELLKRASILTKKYPDYPKLILLDEGLQKMNKDGTQYSHSRYALKIVNEKSLGDAVLTFYYQPSSYESNLIMARSISPDGVVTYLSKDDIKYTTPKQQGLSYFSGKRDVKIITATIPNVKVGSIIDYEWEVIEPAPEDPNQFYTGWYFGGGNPVYESKVDFIVPENKEFYWTTSNFAPFDANPKITKKDGYKTISFVRGECPPYESEPKSPPSGYSLPTASGSTFKDQTYLSNWLSKLMLERMVANDTMKKTINELVTKKGAKTEEEKIAVIYRFVQEYIHYRSIKTSLSSGFSGHPASETFNNRYGDCIDKSILFATLLKIVNVEAYPVIIMTNDRTQPPYGKIGTLSGNHAINEVHLKENGDRIIFLDSTSTTDKYPIFRSDDQGVKAWNPILNSVRLIKPLDVRYNTSSFYYEINLKEDGSGTIKQHRVYRGEWETGLRGYLLSLKEQEIKSTLQYFVASDYPGSILTSYKYLPLTDYSSNLYLDLDSTALGIAKKIGNYDMINNPIGYNFRYLSLQTRKLPIFFATTSGKKHTISINLPKTLKPLGLPESITIKNKYFTYTASYKYMDNTILFEDQYLRTATIIPSKDYISYKKDALKINHFLKTPILFEAQ